MDSARAGVHPPTVRKLVFAAMLGFLAGCGDDSLELRASRTLRGSVEEPDRSHAAMRLHAFSAQRAFVFLPGGRVLETADGGKTWRGVRIRLRNFHFAELIAADGTLWIRGSRCRSGLTRPCDPLLIRTRDAGRHWDVIELDRPLDSAGQMRFASPTVGVLPGYGGLHVTRDGGVTWRWHRRGGFQP